MSAAARLRSSAAAVEAPLLPLVAIAVFVVFVGATLAVAGNTLGYDFAAYRMAGTRFLDGLPIYDRSPDAAGGYGLFLYPPPFVLLAVPFALLPSGIATIVWLGVVVAALLVALAILPVDARTRWLVLLLAGLSWPVVYAIKLGQAGPLVLLAFAVGWRALDRPTGLGLSAALGTILKLQPAIVLPWSALTGRWRAAATGLVALAVAAVVATLVVGIQPWSDYVALLRGVNDPITTAHNFTPGALAYQSGLTVPAAAVLQAVSSVAVVVVMLVAIRWSTAPASYVALVPASQLLSPVLWDHYALLLLLPTAYLLARGQAWAILIPLATSTPLLVVTPPGAYPVVFWIALIAAVSVGRSERFEAAR
jgi:hypothetical protein